MNYIFFSPVCSRIRSAADLVLPVPALLARDLPETDLLPVLGVAELLAAVLVLHQLGANSDREIMMRNHLIVNRDMKL